MCTSKPKPPKVVERDPVKEAAEAERLAAIEANKELAGRRQRYRASSLSTFGGRGHAGPARESAIAKASPGP